MTWYARPSWQLVRQVGADVFVVIWTLIWWFTGRAADETIRLLAEPARQAAGAAEGMQHSFADAGRTVEKVPVIGELLRRPFDSAVGGLGDIVTSAQLQVTSIEQVATMAGLLTWLIPASIVVAFWLPARVRFAVSATAAARFIDQQTDLELLALRALATQPFHILAKVSPDPLAAWRRGDRAVVDALAELELRKYGWRRPVTDPPDGPPPAISA